MEFCNIEEFFKNFSPYRSNEGGVTWPIIVLVDASGSTTEKFGPCGNVVFMAQKDVLLKKYPNNSFRFIFWNSENKHSKNFINGIWTFDYVTSKVTDLFAVVYANKNEFASTKPGLAFNALNRPEYNHWFNNNGPTKIVVPTDGNVDLGHESNLANAIKNLYGYRNNIEIEILAVEPKTRNYALSAEMTNAAGCSLARIIQRERLEDLITNFDSYNPTCLDGFSHMSRVNVPLGFIPFGHYYFPRNEEPTFFNLLTKHVAENNNLDSHMRIIQNIILTIKKLVQDMTPKMSSELLFRYSSIFWFDNCNIDPALATIMLKQAIEGTRTTDLIYADFRSRLNELYKQVDELLRSKNIKQVLGIRRTAISYLIGNIIISVDADLLESDIKVNGVNYSKIGIRIDSNDIEFIFPVFTGDINHGEITPQAIRQFTRTIMSQIIKVNGIFIDPRDDAIMFIVMAMSMKVCTNNLPETVKMSYRYLAKTMLGKKRLNRDQTELSRLLSGEFPLPNNGQINDFYKSMNFCSKYIGISDTIDPMILWYAMCQSLDSELAKKQISHSKQKIIDSFGEVPENLARILISRDDISEIKYFKLEKTLDIKCPVSHENVSLTGGMMINTHSIGNTTCDPRKVISFNVFNSFITNKTGCMDCHRRDILFTQIGPFENNLNIIQISDDHPNPFDAKFVFRHTPIYPSTNVPSLDTTIRSQNKKRILIVGKGTVGAGKTTIWKNLQKKIQENGGECYIEGTDKYSVKGFDQRTAQAFVNKELEKAKISSNPVVVVIIDTCGDHTGNKIFGVSFGCWERHEIFVNLPQRTPELIRGYLAWSLRNVLNRPLFDFDSDFYLNPISANISKCIEVHTKKAQAILQNDFIRITTKHDKNSVLQDIKSYADEYQIFLDSNYSLENTIQELYQRIIGDNNDSLIVATQELVINQNNETSMHIINSSSSSDINRVTVNDTDWQVM